MDGKDLILPELISGSRAGLEWVKRECRAMDSVVCLDANNQSIDVPKRTLRQDWLVRKHELTHVSEADVMWPPPKDKHTRRFFKMLCEVAVESISLHRDGVDIRQARDHLDWSVWQPPARDDMTAWAQLWLQFTMSADVSRHPAIKMIYQRACDALGPERVGWLVQARDAVVLDTGRDARLRWADWLGKCFPRADDTPESPSGEQGSGEQGNESGEQGESSAPQTPNEQEDSAGENEQDDSEDDDDGGEQDSDDTGDDGSDPSGSDDDSDDDGSDDSSSQSDDTGDQDDDSDGTGDAGEPVETTDVDDDDWQTPTEQVVERAGAGRLRAGQEAMERAQEAKEELQRAIDAAWDPDAEHGVWIIGGAKLDIHRHTATRMAQKVVGRGGVRATDSGPRLAFPRRLYQDGRVLARTGRVGGGILIDGSGSMAWSQDKVDHAVEILPGLWVGWYSLHQTAYEYSKTTPDTPFNAAHPSARDEAYTKLRREAPYWARLCIIAEKGRVAEYKPGLETAYHSGGNEVDGDCLAYFARVCQGPRVWVSDGQVYGAPGHAKQIAAIMRQHNIVRVDTVDDAVAYLTGKTVMGYRDCSKRQHRLAR